MSKLRLVLVSPRLPDTALLLLLLLYLLSGAAWRVSAETLSLTPPRGWNSYDSFSWIISEEEFLQNAEYAAANLLPYGYEYIVVDFLWYRKRDPGASVTSPGHDNIDKWGRPVPDPARWPSTKGGNGFKPIADKVHAMGLKFGIHVMRGISTAAVEKNTPILCTKDCPEGFEERNWTAKDIIVPGGECSWMAECFRSVNTSSAGGLAFINSLYEQYADWEVDMIKHDCVFGLYDLNVPEVEAVGKAMERTGRPILYSLSPGVSATPDMGEQVAHLSHMYRITSDDWDSWNDVLSHFRVARDFAAAGLIGAPGLWGGKSWPDMDMLPLGWLTDPGAPYGPWRSSHLTKNEQLTQVFFFDIARCPLGPFADSVTSVVASCRLITLWAIVKSPLMFGGDLRNIDPWTLNLITQPIVLKMNAYSTHNRELSSSAASSLPNVMLEDCGTANFSHWVLNNQNELCWSRDSKPRNPKGRLLAPLTDCLRWRDSPPGLSPSGKYRGIKHGQLSSSTAEADLCLDSRNTDKNALLSRCDGRPSQVWQLIDSSIISEDGFCAVVQESANQWRVWAARGSEGQSYVAFFNLGYERIEISVAVEDIMIHVNFADVAHAPDSDIDPARLLGISPRWEKSTFRYKGRYLRNSNALPVWKSRWSCAGLDVWNNTLFIANVTELTASVESHGTVLYELRCTPGKLSHFSARLFWSLIVLCPLLVGLLAGLAVRRLRTFGPLPEPEDAPVQKDIHEELPRLPGAKAEGQN